MSVLFATRTSQKRRVSSLCFLFVVEFEIVLILVLVVVVLVQLGVDMVECLESLHTLVLYTLNPNDHGGLC